MNSSSTYVDHNDVGCITILTHQHFISLPTQPHIASGTAETLSPQKKATKTHFSDSNRSCSEGSPPVTSSSSPPPSAAANLLYSLTLGVRMARGYPRTNSGAAVTMESPSWVGGGGMGLDGSNVWMCSVWAHFEARFLFRLCFVGEVLEHV